MRNYYYCLLLVLLLPWSASYGMQYHDRASNIVLRPFDGGVYRPPGYLCDECRDVYEHPMDVVGFVYNGFFGDAPWMWDDRLGLPFRVYFSDGSFVLVWFEGVLFDVPTLLPNLMDVLIRMPNGQVLTFTIMQNGPDIPIGDPPPTTDHNSGDDGDNDDDYEEPEDLDEVEIDEPDYIGSVEILDPDEDGDFPEWEEEV